MSDPESTSLIKVQPKWNVGTEIPRYTIHSRHYFMGRHRHCCHWSRSAVPGLDAVRVQPRGHSGRGKAATSSSVTAPSALQPVPAQPPNAVILKPGYKGLLPVPAEATVLTIITVCLEIRDKPCEPVWLCSVNATIKALQDPLIRLYFGKSCICKSCFPGLCEPREPFAVENGL